MDPMTRLAPFLLACGTVAMVPGLLGASSDAPYRWLPHGPGVSSLEAIAVDPTDHDVVYAVTSSGALYRSSDAGTHWSFQSHDLNKQALTLLIDPEFTDILYAGTGSGLFKSVNRGQDWISIDPDPGTQLGAFAITMAPPVALFASNAQGKILKSSDRGESWELSLTLSTGSRFAAAPGSSSTVYAYTFQQVLRTTDAGATWTHVYLGPTFDRLVVSPHDSRVLLATFGAGLFRSRDAGASFEQLASFPSSFVGALAFDPSIDQRILVSSDLSLFETLDGGDTWTPVTPGPNDPIFINVMAFDSSGARLYAGGSRFSVGTNAFLQSEDGGRHWVEQPGQGLFGERTRIVEPHPVDVNAAWTATLNRFYRTKDRGESWDFASLLPFPSDLDVDPTDPQHMLAATYENGVLRTIDGGSSWTPTTGIPFPQVNAVARSPVDTSKAFAASELVYRSTDGGASWSAADQFSPHVVQSVAVSICRGITAILAGGPAGVFRSEDDGASWIPAEGVPAGAVLTRLAVLDETRDCLAFAQAWDSLFRSVDGGKSFSRVPVPAPVLSIGRGLVMNPAYPRELFLFDVFDVYRSLDRGRTWRKVTNPTLGSALGIIDGTISRDGKTLYAATEGSLYRLDRRFTDVAPSSPDAASIDAVALHGVTAGCGGGRFCPTNPVSRAQSSVFLLRSLKGSEYEPPAATGTVFTDVPANGFAAAWIEEMSGRGITGGCGGGLFCPDLDVTRAQAAVLNLRTKNGSAYQPPPATGTMFADVPASHFAAAWIEEFAREGYTAGCAPNLFCPEQAVSRGQMAVFLAAVFALL